MWVGWVWAGCGRSDGTAPAGDPVESGHSAESAESAESAAHTGDPEVEPLRVELIRVPSAGPDPFRIRVAGGEVVIRVDGRAVDGRAVDGGWEVRVEPAADGDLVEVEVERGGEVWRRTALVLEVGDRWGQPELVPGLVNTPAYEDGPEVSPDGEWLIVSNYAPIDMISCLLAAPGELPDPAAPACNTVLGPSGPPERPDLPGADRVLEDDVIHAIPELGLVGEDGGDFLVPLPPTAAYGFRRQPDGTFAEPFVVAYDMYGLNNAPFGLSFVPGHPGRVVFSWDDVSTSRQDGDLFVADLVLGEPNWLGTVDAAFQVTPPPTPWPVSTRVGLQSNAFAVDDTTVLYDQHLPESTPQTSDVYVDDGVRKRVAGFSRPDREEFQPFVHGDEVVFVAGGFESIVTASWSGGDLAARASFGPEELVVRGGGRTVAVGEPSVGLHDGVPTVYFLAGRLPESGGIDNTVARVAAIAP
jgi:hypothetical protein